MDHKEKHSDKSFQRKDRPQIRDPSQKYGSDLLKSNQETQSDQEKDAVNPDSKSERIVIPHQYHFSASGHDTSHMESVMVDVLF